jgi:hypothetical protein
MQARYALPWLVVAWVVLACGIALGAEGQSAEKKQEPTPEPLTVKVYRVEDLFIKRDWTSNRVGLPDLFDLLYPSQAALSAAGGGTGVGALFGTSRSETTEVGPAELVDIIKRTLHNSTDPNVAKWSDVEGPAVIEYISMNEVGMLLVSQTRAGQKKVEDLLEQLRNERDVCGPMLTISAHWVEVDEGKAALLMGRDPKRRVPLEITAADIEKAGAKTVYRGSTTCFDRQTVFVSSGRAKVYMGDMIPIVSEASVGGDPTICCLLVGALLEVRPQLSRARDTVLLDFRTFVNQNGAVEYRPIPDFGAVRGQKAMRVDLGYPEVDFHTLRGSIRIPLDKTILVGGCTSAKMKDGKVLYLVVEVSASKDPREAAAEAPKK